MIPNFEQKLIDYPWMKISRYEGANHHPYEAWGCECGRGWLNLIRGMCQDLTELYQSKGKEVNLVPSQIKEKFGTLRLYIDFPFDEEPDDELRSAVRQILSKWEEASVTVCENCGNEGSLRRGSWLQTLCDKCYKGLNKESEEN